MGASKTSPDGAPQHPMIAVPEAIRIVLETTAKSILLQQQQQQQQQQTTDGGGSTEQSEEADSVSCNAPATKLLGRILAADVIMSEPGYPPYRASIMDGYAIQSSHKFQPKNDNETNESWTHQVLDRVHAGPSSFSVAATTPTTTTNSTTPESVLPSAVYVTTGAKIPDFFDCVVPIEEIEESTDQTNIRVHPTAVVKPNEWIRDVGCDIAAGSIILPRGSRLDAVSLGLIQQSGQTHCQLVKPLRVGVLSTGNELLVSTDAWAHQLDDNNNNNINNNNNNKKQRMLIQTGQIPDVNKPILLSLLTTVLAANCQPIDLGMERDDDVESMTNTLRQAVEDCHVILTTGGISMGETDIVEHVLVQRLGGTLHFGRLNMKPGKPTTFVTIPNAANSKMCLVFALPGNPVSAFVCTQLVVRPALTMLLQYKSSADILSLSRNTDSSKKDTQENTKQLIDQMVQNALVQPEIVATITHDIKLDMERPEYHRVVLGLNRSSTNQAGMEYTATSTGVQRSSRLMSLVGAQGLLVIPQGTPQKPKVLAGETYPVLLLEDHHQPVRVKDSRHLRALVVAAATTRTPTRVAITQISQDPSKYAFIPAAELSEQVEEALSGSRSGSVVVVSCREYAGPPDKSIVTDFWKNSVSEADNTMIDLWVVACSGSFTYSLQVSQVLREQVGKVADAIALQARRGAAAQEGVAALFEPVVGYLEARQQGSINDQPSLRDSNENGCMLIALPTSGLAGGLDSVRGLLKHALNVARGKPHNHHHKGG